MTEEKLKQNGFKKKKLDNDYWFELNIGHHRFITNDTLRNKRQDKWFIGYENKKEMDEPFWFNCKLSNYAEFKTIFRTLTGIEFKLAHQRKLVR